MKVSIEKKSLNDIINRLKWSAFFFIEGLSCIVIVPSSILYFYSFASLSTSQVNYVLHIMPGLFIIFILLNVIIFHHMFKPVYTFLKFSDKRQTLHDLKIICIRVEDLNISTVYSGLMILRWLLCFVIVSLALYAGPGINLRQFFSLTIAITYGMTFSTIIASITVTTFLNEFIDIDNINMAKRNF